MKKITLTINGKIIQAQPGTTILEAAREHGIQIPTLCFLKELGAVGACRVCVVEVEGEETLQAACSTPVAEGMVIHTDSKVVRDSRRMTLELILSDHPYVCPTCGRNNTCELQRLADDLDISMYFGFYSNPAEKLKGEQSKHPLDDSGFSVVRDPAKCVKCYRCVSVCDQVQGIHAITFDEKGFQTTVKPVVGAVLADTDCVSCGQCVRVCPTGALQVHDNLDELRAALADPQRYVVVQTAPSIRVSLGEAFGLEPGSITTGQMVSALRRIGFDKVFDTNFGADLTVMEEGSELLERLHQGDTLPMFTSCCPAWVKWVEQYYPQYIPNLSTCKSPQQMFGAITKSWYAKKAGIRPESIFCVSVMPCTAKKAELRRNELAVNGLADVDFSITTVELARLLQQQRIDVATLPEEDFDSVLGESTGAGAIFGATGGVMEAALRTACELTGETAPASLDFHAVRGSVGVREAAFTMKGKELKVAVVSGLAEVRKLMEAIDAGKADYQFVEVMACPGGCVGGGGQPVPFDEEIRKKRAAAIYKVDESMSLRKSHENPAVKEVYAELLGSPLSEKSHELLHRTYAEVEK